MTSNGAPQKPIRMEKSALEISDELTAGLLREDREAWECAHSTYGNGAAMNAFLYDD